MRKPCRDGLRGEHRGAARKLHYVVAAGQKDRDRLLAEFETVDGFVEVIRQPSPRNPSQQKSSVRVKAHPLNNETLILCISHERVEKDRAIREKHEGRFLKDLARVQARIQNGRLKNDVKIGEAIGRLKKRYPRVARYHSLSFDAKTRQLKNEPDEEKREMAASLDGSYLLRTDRQDLSAEEGWRIYASLTRVAAPRDSHVMGDGSRPAGDSPDRDDRSADRPERSSADSSERDCRTGPQGSVRGAWGADRDHTSSKDPGEKPAE